MRRLMHVAEMRVERLRAINDGARAHLRARSWWRRLLVLPWLLALRDRSEADGRAAGIESVMSRHARANTPGQLRADERNTP